MKKLTTVALSLLMIASMLFILSGCTGDAVTLSEEQDVRSERGAFDLSPADFKTAIMEHTDFVLIPAKKDTIMQFEDSAASATLTAMLYDDRITTVVFQVQGADIAEHEMDAYVGKLETVAGIVLGTEAACDASLFTRAQAVTVSGAALTSTVEPGDVTIMMVP
ncbi:hypothetical protein LJC74_07130 [Eubacteriales bacterium OttesenSCG-928-A19]|nr:hypothetical protein [Eubacteriales bacterium OttesenSCG-928-A19]